MQLLWDCIVHWSVIDILDFVNCYHCHWGLVQAKTVWLVFCKHVQANHLVACKFKSIRLQNFFNRLNFLDNFDYLLLSVNAATKIKWIIPVQLGLRPPKLKKLQVRQRHVWFNKWLEIWQAHDLVASVGKVDAWGKFEMKRESLWSLVEIANTIVEVDIVEKNHIVNHETKKWQKLMAFFLCRHSVDYLHNLVYSTVFKYELSVWVLLLQLVVILFEMFFIWVSVQYFDVYLQVVATAVMLKGFKELAKLVWSVFAVNKDIQIVLGD